MNLSSLYDAWFNYPRTYITLDFFILLLVGLALNFSVPITIHYLAPAIYVVLNSRRNWWHGFWIFWITICHLLVIPILNGNYWWFSELTTLQFFARTEAFDILALNKSQQVNLSYSIKFWTSCSLPNYSTFWKSNDLVHTTGWIQQQLTVHWVLNWIQVTSG